MNGRELLISVERFKCSQMSSYFLRNLTHIQIKTHRQYTFSCITLPVACRRPHTCYFEKPETDVSSASRKKNTTKYYFWGKTNNTRYTLYILNSMYSMERVTELSSPLGISFCLSENLNKCNNYFKLS